MERSGDTAYAPLAEGLARTLERTMGTPGAASPPSVIADVISEAVAARKPKTRYAAGKLAKQLLFTRRWFSDRRFDKAISGMVR